MSGWPGFRKNFKPRMRSFNYAGVRIWSDKLATSETFSAFGTVLLLFTLDCVFT